MGRSSYLLTQFRKIVPFVSSICCSLDLCIFVAVIIHILRRTVYFSVLPRNHTVIQDRRHEYFLFLQFSIHGSAQYCRIEQAFLPVMKGEKHHLIM